jgi:heme exporter protein C
MAQTARPGWPAALGVAVLIGVAGYAALLLAPIERTMGEIQRIFYFHMPSGLTGLVAFTIVFIANIAYLATRRAHWDWLGVSAAEVGVAFTSVVLVTGPIWAKPVWGIWWTWDARLTSTFMLWLLYVSYLVLRTLLTEPERQAMVSAVFGIFAYLDVPLVYLSIRIWRTQHPQPVVFGGRGSGLDPAMRGVLFICWAALLGVMVLLLWQRYRLEAMRHDAEELLAEAEARAAARERLKGKEAMR